MDPQVPPPDPLDLTQTILLPPVTPSPRARTVAVSPASETPFVHRFGSVPWYLFARSAAFVLDVFGIAFLIATFEFNATQRGFMLFAGRDQTGFDILALVALGIAIIFALTCEALFGTTIGKLVFALHVRRRDGRRAGMGRAFLRALLQPIDLLLFGPLLALVTPRHQRLGDVVAGTVVARSRIGAIASLLGLVLAGLLTYGQITFGGGLDSAIGVAAETSTYVPAYVARALAALGLRVSSPVGNPVASPPAQTPAPQSSGALNG